MTSSILFYFSANLLCICSFLVVTSRHAIFSVLFLASSFIFSSLLFFILECEFLALLFLAIYLGAILVLFLFGVMLLEFKLINLLTNELKFVPIGLTFSTLLLCCFFMNITLSYNKTESDFSYLYYNTYHNWYQLTDSIKDVQVYGQILYSYYVLQFLISGLILLLVLISVIYMTNNLHGDQETKKSAFRQLSKKRIF